MKNKKRHHKVILDFLLVITATVMFMYAVVAIAATTSCKPVRYTEYTVSQGDTLWDIAVEYKAPQTNINAIIYEIRKVNNIETYIYPGQKLLIPVEKEGK